MKEELYQEKILKAAYRLCKKQGPKSLTINNLVAESKISKRSFYMIFPTKDDFLAELKRHSKGNCPLILDERMAIIQAAEEGISKYGFNNINLDAIAGSAGLKRGAIYKYFDDKYDLLEYCIEYQFTRLKGMVEEIYLQNQEDPEAFFRIYITRFSNYINNNNETTIYTEVFSHLNYRKKIRAQAKGIQDFLQMIFADCLIKGIELGIFREDMDVETASQLLMITVNGMGFYLGEERREDEEMIRPKTTEAILKLLFHHIKKNPE